MHEYFPLSFHNAIAKPESFREAVYSEATVQTEECPVGMLYKEYQFVKPIDKARVSCSIV